MKTKYSIVKESIKTKILDGTYQAHQKISSESELMKQFGVSRHTVRLAVGDLVIEGWLYREQGSGTFCAEKTEKNNKSISNQKNIAIITTYISDYIFPSIISGAELFLSEKGYNVSLFSTNNNHEKERKVLEKILTGSFNGVIIEPTKSAISNPNIGLYLNLESLKIPYIMINAYYDELEPVSITVDDEQGGFIQTEHLIKLGHRNIVGIFKTDDNQGSKRMKGFLKAHRMYNIPLNPNFLITYGTDEKAKTREELGELLKLREENNLTAVACYHDELAIFLLDYIREQSLCVPEDISLIGFDNSFLSNITGIKLTTISHPKHDLGKAAAKKILELINKEINTKTEELPKVESVVFTPELIIRNSVKNLLK